MNAHATTFLRLVVDWVESTTPDDKQQKLNAANAALAQMTPEEKTEMQQTLRDYMTGDFNAAIMGARKKATAERTQQIIDAYVKEYERVNGRKIPVTEKRGWITLDGFHKMRVSEMRKALDVLKGRANFVSTETATFNPIQK